jgi:hypothetical protein
MKIETDFQVEDTLSSLAAIVKKIDDYPSWSYTGRTNIECMLFEFRKILNETFKFSNKIKVDQNVKELEMVTELSRTIIILFEHHINNFHVYSDRSEGPPKGLVENFEAFNKIDEEMTKDYLVEKYLDLSADPCAKSILQSNCGNSKSPKCGRTNFSPDVIKILTSWIKTNKDNPFPSLEEKQKLVSSTKISMKQLNNWFVNARRRKYKTNKPSIS